MKTPTGPRRSRTATPAPARSCVSSFAEGKLDDRIVELDVRDRNQPSFEIMTNMGPNSGPGMGQDQGGDGMDLREMLPGLFGQRTKKRKMKVVEAFDYLVQEEESRLIDMDQVTRLAVERVEDSGMVFLDEIDKIAGREGGHGPDVSREGVQRDILPIVERHYRQHQVRHGLDRPHSLHRGRRLPRLEAVRPHPRTAGAASQSGSNSTPSPSTTSFASSPSPSHRSSNSRPALLETEGLKLEFSKEAILEMAQFAFRVNETTENIGARRLHTIMERVLDEISFQAPDLFKSPRPEATEEGVVAEIGASSPLTADPQPPAPPLPVIERQTPTGTEKVIVIDPEYVRQQVASIVKDQDLSRYIL